MLLGRTLLLCLEAVRQQSANALLIDLVNVRHSVELPLHARRLPATEVAFHPMGPHELSGGSDLEAPLSAFMRFGFDFRHDVAPLLARARSASV